ncbi:MAG: GNAT family N-acetyltransferase [Deltaproteobacteria bacterium]|nr:GNAT family N-acetyltransferase [Deltaproteobacteria bacterium]
MSLIIRRAEYEDLPAILELYGHLDSEQVLPWEEAGRIFRRMKRYPDYRLYVATRDNRIVGTFALLIMDNLAHQGAPSGIVEDVVVHPDWRRHGIGKEMMRFAMRRCQEKGCYKMSLSTNLKREAAHRFYESLGFQKHGYSFFVEF